MMGVVCSIRIHPFVLFFAPKGTIIIEAGNNFGKNITSGPLLFLSGRSPGRVEPDTRRLSGRIDCYYFLKVKAPDGQKGGKTLHFYIVKVKGFL